MSDEPRTLKTHCYRGPFIDVAIRVTNEGSGNESAVYEISRPYRLSVVIDKTKVTSTRVVVCEIPIQRGEPMEVGINGVSEEALLAIVLDLVCKRIDAGESDTRMRNVEAELCNVIGQLKSINLARVVERCRKATGRKENEGTKNDGRHV